ncbi:hypothetical protein GDO86_000557 [Hymenochirus boettgeri]|uniref:SH3 domain-containing protein n=1 Tax=Hymenochirus boettgeri TaxID=247094 RepID=A0A8T2KCF8_9PIPI|nr:hypothetical protein GDO86_000557 [Hymenochirus boettgeri]
MGMLIWRVLEKQIRQGPLSSIRAVIKRTSRTTTQSEQQRERRRPEITIVAAEPIGPGSWFHGGAPAGLGFPPPPPPQWRPSESHPTELPPSYEQVIKEITQVQVTTANCNVEPRRTTTCSTQTDFQAEEELNISGHNVIDQPVFCEQEPLTAQKAPDISRQTVSLLPYNVSDSISQVAVCNITETVVRPEDPNVFRHPVPRPRTKSNLKPVGNNIFCIFQENNELLPHPTLELERPFIQPCSAFDDHIFETNNMSHERSQNSIVSRIKAFESQAEVSEQPRRPEIVPRSFSNRSSVAVKPTPAPKPASNRTSGEWESSKDNKPKVIPREGLVPPKLTDTGGTIKPELPKKPKSGIVKSSSSDFSEGVLGTTLSFNSNTKDIEQKVPVPAPRPLISKKPLQNDPSNLPTAVPRPHGPAPKLSVAKQAKAFSASEVTSARITAPASQIKTLAEVDLISFDDDVLIPSPEVTNDTNTSVDPFQFKFSTDETEKDLPTQPAPQKKPTVIKVSGKLGKSSEELQAPPPLPAEKPVGSLYNKASMRPRPVGRKEWESSKSGEDSWARPALPKRPAGFKVMEIAQQPQKGPPGRPPPPKVSKATSQRDAIPRSSSDVGITAKHNTSGISRSKSQVIKRQQPELPPRPKPGHPLYNKYTFSLPHGIADKDALSSKPGELSCKRGEVLVLLEQTSTNYIHCQKGLATGEVKVSNMKIITPLIENLDNRQNVSSVEDSHVPHGVVLHDFKSEHADDLTISAGETVYLLEKIDNEWYRGKCKGYSGIFPANHIKVIVSVLRLHFSRKINFFRLDVFWGPRCVARFEFIGDQKDELSFSEGDMIILKEYINDEWVKGELKGQTGVFPINFVEIIEDLPAADLGEMVSDALDLQKNKMCGLVAQQTQTSGDWAEALYEFSGETEDDLAFKKGDKILIIEKLDTDWYRGRLNGRDGILPSAFVQLTSGLKLWETQGGKEGKAQALYDFCGENDDELTFKAGDIILGLESIDHEWMSGELNGRSGIFPKNFVQRC